LSDANAEYRTVLLDVSRTGARVSGRHLPEVGAEVAFRASEIQAFADVVWREEDVCAVEFQTPLAPWEVQRLRSLAALEPDS
jgi:hypothetical protein